MKDSCVFILLVAALTIASVHSQAPVFLDHPTSIAAVDGSTVEFTCTANNTDTINYRVDNTPASNTDVMDKGFTELGTEPLDIQVTRRNLSVIVSSLYNSTEILCRASGTDDIVSSNTAILTVQGPLSSVDGLSYSFIDSSTINISWSPPFTLPGTHITGYNISVIGRGTNCSNNNVTIDDFTSSSHYLLSLTDSPYNDFTITVSGYNGLNGENESISVFISEATLPTTVLNISIDGELSLEVNLTEFCVDDIVTNVTVTLLEGGMINQSINIPPTIILSNVFELMQNQNYTVNVSFSVYEEEYMIQNFTNFDTYGVQSLHVTDTSEDTVYIVCLFNTFSTDSGCTVVLVSTTDQQQQYNGTFNKMDDNTASGNITGVVTGVYNIHAFDQDSNVVAVELLNVTITGEPLSTTTNTLTPVPTSTSISTISSSSVPTFSPTPTSPPTSDKDPPIIIFIIIVVVVLLLVVVAVILLCYCIYKKKRISAMKLTTSSDTFIPSPPNDNKSPTNPYPSQNLDDLYSRPNMAAKTNAQPVVYADLSIIRQQASVKNNKPHPSPITDNSRVVYSDLLLKGQPPPPPYEPIELKQQPSSVTVIPPTITVKENKEEQITEFFFSHPGHDDDDGVVTVPAQSRPPPPDGRAPSPPTENPNDVPPPIPSRSHDSRLPDVVHQYNITQDNEYADESLHPTLEEFRSEKDDHKGFMNTPTATYL